ncbi:hypothetical protein EVAR_22823_1 [Eumeta japonica]|uniref:Uncharacterized protein n=1 Tax=Eumeta variegata TaxID=151549 RepID=A0A4C1VER9_EUMVA|nr:hypothetical protein EVAR_22823_1 [Eumeta japonica]
MGDLAGPPRYKVQHSFILGFRYRRVSERRYRFDGRSVGRRRSPKAAAAPLMVRAVYTQLTGRQVISRAAAARSRGAAL